MTERHPRITSKKLARIKRESLAETRRIILENHSDLVEVRASRRRWNNTGGDE